MPGTIESVMVMELVMPGLGGVLHVSVPEPEARKILAFMETVQEYPDLTSTLARLPVIAEARELLLEMGAAEIKGPGWVFPAGRAVVNAVARAADMAVGGNAGRAIGGCLGVAMECPVISWFMSILAVTLHAYIGLPLGYWRSLSAEDADTLNALVADHLGPFAGLELPLS